MCNLKKTDRKNIQESLAHINNVNWQADGPKGFYLHASFYFSNVVFTQLEHIPHFYVFYATLNQYFNVVVVLVFPESFLQDNRDSHFN